MNGKRRNQADNKDEGKWKADKEKDENTEEEKNHNYGDEHADTNNADDKDADRSDDYNDAAAAAVAADNENKMAPLLEAWAP